MQTVHSTGSFRTTVHPSFLKYVSPVNLSCTFVLTRTAPHLLHTSWKSMTIPDVGIGLQAIKGFGTENYMYYDADVWTVTHVFRFVSNRERFKAFVSSLGAMADEALLTVDGDGLLCACMDPAHVALVESKMVPSAFVSFEPNGSHEVGLRVDRTLYFLSVMCGENVSVSFDEKKKLVMKSGNLTVRVGTVDVDGVPRPKIPHISFQETFGVDAGEVLRFAQSVEGDYSALRLRASPSGVTLESIDSTEDGTPETVMDVPCIDRTVATGDTVSAFSTEYVLAMLKSLCNRAATFSFSNEYPLRMSAEAGGLSTTFVLAPRIEQK